MKILVTGAAGFIGFHTVQRFLKEGHDVVGLDNINDYYPTSLKYDRLEYNGIERLKIKYDTHITSKTNPNYRFIKLDLDNSTSLYQLFQNEKFDIVINLAAQAGVRYSLENPRSYIKSNIEGFLNLLESCRFFPPKQLIYASSSSVYGANHKQPFSTEDQVDRPINMYAVSKKTNELMAHAYAHLYNIKTVGLRFFTVYGPWGRPDMAPFLFADAICSEKPIQVFNHGQMKRDFTYIDDIVEGIFKVSKTKIEDNYKIFNIGNNKPVALLDFIQALENSFGKKALLEYVDMQPGDLQSTWADIDDLQNLTNYRPDTTITQGVKHFVEWYKSYFES